VRACRAPLRLTTVHGSSWGTGHSAVGHREKVTVSAPRLGLPRFGSTLWACIVLGIGAVVAVAAAPSPQSAAGAAPVMAGPVAINDNRTVAGMFERGTLTVRLDARPGKWHPDADADPGVVVHAFAVEGGPLQIPAPVLRVVEGTEIRAFVRNSLPGGPLFVHGLYSRPTKTPEGEAPVSIPPGEVREIRFVAGAAGAYYYWAASGSDVALAQRAGRDSQLSGAFIVDPRGGTPQLDRVFVVTRWNELRPVGTEQVPVGRIAMNGKSWPHTERLTYNTGESVRMRVLNVGALVHPMHLHGFYFNVDSRGDERADTVFPPGSSPHLVNTERLAPGRTFSLTWVPTRPGNWLFHCHDSVHIIQTRQLDGSQVLAPASHHPVNHALDMMAGPVIGITVRSGKADAPSRDSDAGERRRLRLVTRVDSGGTQPEPAYGFSLHDGGTVTPSSAPYLPAPTILLKRNEPVSITVVNQLPEATAVHWHGIELESYYDGVAGFAGGPGRIAPAIPPGGSFEARFTPPRAGTFIYHSHVDEVRQQQAGLSGALLVLDSPASYDPARDIVLLVTTPRLVADAAVVLLNGTSTPAPREMRVGERYRLRFINVHTARPSMRMRMLRDNALVTWRALAKDGMDLPADQAITGPSEIQMGNGETYDFEFVPTAVGENVIEVRSNPGDLLVAQRVHIH
jgi:FtsP/CotA-like multicopper oxidase with cupredoxin domain